MSAEQISLSNRNLIGGLENASGHVHCYDKSAEADVRLARCRERSSRYTGYRVPVSAGFLGPPRCSRSAPRTSRAANDLTREWSQLARQNTCADVSSARVSRCAFPRRVSLRDARDRERALTYVNRVFARALSRAEIPVNVIAVY